MADKENLTYFNNDEPWAQGCKKDAQVKETGSSH